MYVLYIHYIRVFCYIPILTLTNVEESDMMKYKKFKYSPTHCFFTEFREVIIFISLAVSWDLICKFKTFVSRIFGYIIFTNLIVHKKLVCDFWAGHAGVIRVLLRADLHVHAYICIRCFCAYIPTHPSSYKVHNFYFRDSTSSYF